MKQATQRRGSAFNQFCDLFRVQQIDCRRRGKRTRRASLIESLESRELLAATVTSTNFLATGTLSSGAASLNVTFSESVFAAATTVNYELQRAGTDGLIGSSDDEVISLTSASYSPATRVTTLGFSPLVDDAYRLTVKDQITDSSGAFLDGDANGVQGGNYVQEFIVGGQVKSFEGTSSPSTVNGLSNVTEVAAGVSHYLALRKDGTVWAWGNNAFGQIGDGATATRSTPVQVPGLTNVKSVVAGSYASFAILSDGTVRGWGRNSARDLGDGTTTNRLSPIVIPGLSGVKQLSSTRHDVASSETHTLALLSNGTVKAWGNNNWSQASPGSFSPVLTPTTIAGLTGVSAVAAGHNFSLAMLANGTVRSWGLNIFGQLGDGTTTNRSTPVTVSGLTSAVSIAAGERHAVAVLSNGTVRAWGDNQSRQLGDLTTSQRSFPVQVSGVTSATRAVAGERHSAALLSDGRVYHWGSVSSTPTPVSGLQAVGNLNSSTYGSIVARMPTSQIASIEFATAGSTGIEGTTVQPMLLVKGTIVEPQSIEVVLNGGTANASDVSTTTVTIPAGVYDGTEWSAIPLNVAIQSDELIEDHETIGLLLVHPSAQLIIGDANANSAVQYEHTLTIAGQIPPTVVGTTPSFATSGTLPAGTSSIVVTFDRPVADVGVDGNNFDLRSEGPDGLLGTADDVVVSLTVVNGNTFGELYVDPLPEGIYRLSVRDSITDPNGIALDGDANGTPGGNWVRDFVVVAQQVELDQNSANGLTFGVDQTGFGSGQLVQGTDGTFDGMNRLEVNGEHYAPAADTPTVHILHESISQTESSLSNSFSTVSGLSTTLTHESSAFYRVSAAINFSVESRTSAPIVAEIGVFVDDALSAVRQYELNSAYVNADPSQFHVNLSEFLSISTTGPHSVDIRVRALTGDTILLDGTFNSHSFTLVRVNSSDSGSRANVVANLTSTGGDIFLTNSFTAVPSLTTTYTISDPSDVYHANSLLSFFGDNLAGGSNVLAVEAAYFIDGVQSFTQRFQLQGRDPSNGDASQHHLVFEDYFSGGSVGTHVLEVRVRSVSGAVGLARSSSSNTLQFVRYSSSPVDTGAVSIVTEQTYSASDFRISSAFVVPGLTSTFNVSDVNERYRVSANLNFAAYPPAVFANVPQAVQATFLVDGVPAHTRQIELGPDVFGFSHATQYHVFLEDYVAFTSLGSHTVQVQISPLNNPSGQPLYLDGDGNTLRVLRFPSVPLVRLNDDGKTIATQPQIMAGLEITREVTVPDVGTEDFARTVEVLFNPTGSSIAVPVRMVGNLGSDAATTVFATSDGDTIVEPTDLWFGTDDVDGTGTPAIIHLLHGPFGLQPSSVNVIGDNVEWTYDLTVPAGETKRLVSFTVLGTTRAEAIAAVNALVTSSGFGGQAAAFLTHDELNSLANFQFNLAPADVSLSKASLDEIAGVNAVIGTLSATDPNPGDTFTFSLPSGADDNDLFNISGTSLRANGSFDFETHSSYTVTVRVTDAGGLTFDKQFVIAVTNVNEAPTDIELSNAVVSENAAGWTVVGAFTSTDPDTGSTFSYALVTGDGDSGNGSFTIVGDVLRTNAAFDFETQDSYSIRVRSTDQGGLSVEKIFTISVTNITELNSIDVQLGLNQRSYVRYLDAVFDRPDELQDLLNNNRLQLNRYDLNGTNGTTVALPSYSIVGNTIRFDFGIQGIGGNRNSNVGDGYYQLVFDHDGDGGFEAGSPMKSFHRLLGDVNGDGKVDAADKSQVLLANRTSNAESDTNGDGIVNLTDVSLTSRAFGRKLKDDLFTDD